MLDKTESKGKLVWMYHENIEALEELKTKYGLKSPNRVVSILLDLEKKTKGLRLINKYVCHACNDKEFDIPDNISRAYKLKGIIRHSDLENDSKCNSPCKKELKINYVPIEMYPSTIEMYPSTTGIKDTKTEVTKIKDEHEDTIEEEIKPKIMTMKEMIDSM